MGITNLTIIILVLVFCVGIPLLILTAFLLRYYCGEESNSDNPRRYGTSFFQDSDEDNTHSHVRESVHLSTSFNQHRHRVQPPVPSSIPTQDDTIIDTAGLNQSIIESLPSGPIGEKVLMDNPGLECSICLAEYSVDDIVRRLPCTHAFHLHCIDHWLNHNLVCPICKFNLKHLLHPSQ